MRILTNTLSVVILADWNKLFVQPDWVAQNIFEKSKMEINIETQGVECNLFYKCNGISINPTRDKVILTALELNEETISYLAKCAMNYMLKAYTPCLMAWGINVDYYEINSTLLPQIFDDIADFNTYINLLYDVTSTQLDRTIEKDGKTINIQYCHNSSQTMIHFNEHHNKPDEEDRKICDESIWEFINQTKEIVTALGYVLEEDDE